MNRGQNCNCIPCSACGFAMGFGASACVQALSCPKTQPGYDGGTCLEWAVEGLSPGYCMSQGGYSPPLPWFALCRMYTQQSSFSNTNSKLPNVLVSAGGTTSNANGWCHRWLHSQSNITVHVLTTRKASKFNVRLCVAF